MLRTLPILSLLLLMSACTSSAEYPEGIKTNAVMGKTVKQISYPDEQFQAKTPKKGEGLISTKPAKGGQNAICVGTWCSCDTQ